MCIKINIYIYIYVYIYIHIYILVLDPCHNDTGLPVTDCWLEQGCLDHCFSVSILQACCDKPAPRNLAVANLL